MSYTITGKCPRCGAPIYTPLIWHGIMPPPAHHSCNCFPNSTRVETSTSLSNASCHVQYQKKDPDAIDDLVKNVEHQSVIERIEELTALFKKHMKEEHSLSSCCCKNKKIAKKKKRKQAILKG